MVEQCEGAPGKGEPWPLSPLRSIRILTPPVQVYDRFAMPYNTYDRNYYSQLLFERDQRAQELQQSYADAQRSAFEDFWPTAYESFSDSAFHEDSYVAVPNNSLRQKLASSFYGSPDSRYNSQIPQSPATHHPRTHAP